MTFLRLSQERILTSFLENNPTNTILDLGGDKRSSLSIIMNDLAIESYTVNYNNYSDLQFDLELADLSSLTDEYPVDIICSFNLFEHMYNSPHQLNSILSLLNNHKINTFIVSTPFFYKYHPSPHDYVRYTEFFYDSKILQNLNLDSFHISRFHIGGSFLQVCIDYTFTYHRRYSFATPIILFLSRLLLPWYIKRTTLPTTSKDIVPFPLGFVYIITNKSS